MFVVLFTGETLSHLFIGGSLRFLLVPALSALITLSAALWGWRQNGAAPRLAPWLLVAIWACAATVVVQHLASSSALAAFIFMCTLLVATPALVLSLIPMLVAESATLALHFMVSAQLPGLDVFSIWVLLPLLCVAATIYIARRSAVLSAEHSRQYQLELAARTAAVERLASLNTMAAGIAHHTSNRLQAIMGSADLLLRDGDEDTQAFLEQIWQESNRLANLIVPLRTFAGSAAGVRDFVTARQIIEDAGLPALLSDHAELEIDIAADLPTLAVYVGEIEEALRCLMRNAAEANARSVVLTVARNPEGVTFALTDDGEGMQPDELERALDPFYTSRGPGRLGLGLAYVAGAVRNHNGTLTIDSTSGRGTVVTFDLPA